jgi:hypothetical protein
LDEPSKRRVSKSVSKYFDDAKSAILSAKKEQPFSYFWDDPSPLRAADRLRHLLTELNEHGLMVEMFFTWSKGLDARPLSDQCCPRTVRG